MPEERNSFPSLFSINSDNEDFAARQKNVFEQLNAAEINRINGQENKCSESSSSESTTVSEKTQKAKTEPFRCQKSIFKVPAVSLRKSLAASRIPDYCINPHKWTKYSLENVDTSDRSNTAAALSFLKEMEGRQQQEEEMETEGEKKIVFQKSAIVKTKLEDDRDEEKLRFRSSKVVMPEYVVGQKIKNEKKKRSTKSKSTAKQLKLDHLMEDDDEEDN